MKEQLYCALDGEELGVAEDFGKEGKTLVCPRGHYWYLNLRSETERLECLSGDFKLMVEGVRGDDGDN